MQRTPEPELMLDQEQARAYAEADFTAPNAAFVQSLGALFPDLPHHLRGIDLGCGPGDILLRLAALHPGWELLGIDGSAAMLDEGMERVCAAGRESQVTLVQARLPDASLPEGQAELLISNSLLHHLPEPAVLWSELRRLGAPGAAALVVDLRRPADAAEVEALVHRWSAAEPEILQRDFRASLHAAYTCAEVEAQLRTAGLDLRCAEISDRHLAVWGRLP